MNEQKEDSGLLRWRKIKTIKRNWLLKFFLIAPILKIKFHLHNYNCYLSYLFFTMGSFLVQIHLCVCVLSSHFVGSCILIHWENRTAKFSWSNFFCTRAHLHSFTHTPHILRDTHTPSKTHTHTHMKTHTECKAVSHAVYQLLPTFDPQCKCVCGWVCVSVCGWVCISFAVCFVCKFLCHMCVRVGVQRSQQTFLLSTKWTGGGDFLHQKRCNIKGQLLLGWINSFWSLFALPNPPCCVFRPIDSNKAPTVSCAPIESITSVQEREADNYWRARWPKNIVLFEQEVRKQNISLDVAV